MKGFNRDENLDLKSGYIDKNLIFTISISQYTSWNWENKNREKITDDDSGVL